MTTVIRHLGNRNKKIEKKELGVDDIRDTNSSLIEKGRSLILKGRLLVHAERAIKADKGIRHTIAVTFTPAFIKRKG